MTRQKLSTLEGLLTSIGSYVSLSALQEVSMTPIRRAIQSFSSLSLFSYQGYISMMTQGKVKVNNVLLYQSLSSVDT